MNSIKAITSLLLLVFISECHSAVLVTLSTKCLVDFRAASLSAHNTYRAAHSTAALKQNASIDAIALKYATYLGQNDLFQHSGAKGLGENLASSWSSNTPDLNNCGALGTKFVKMWYDEIKAYNFNNPGFSSTTGHFTQVLWKSTTQLGCGLSVNKGNKIYGVCNYSPAGNIINAGYFKANVLPLKSG